MNPPPVQAAPCARKAGPSSCRQQLALHRRRGVGGAGQSVPVLRSRVQCSHRGGNGGASQLLLPLQPTGALGQCLMRGTGGRSLQILAAKVSLGGGRGWRGEVPGPLTAVTGTDGGGGRRLCRGMCVLSLLRRNGFRMIQGIAGKRVRALPAPPAAISLSRSFPM